MKTLEYFKKEQVRMVQEASEFHPKLRKTKVYRNLMEEMEMNKLYLLYMETSPTEEFLKKELNRLSSRMACIDAGVPAKTLYRSEEGWKQARKKYYELMKVKELKEKIKAIEYLLSE